jgi:DNA-directed RNA polymerase specialized sigma24 family protein
MLQIDIARVKKYLPELTPFARDVFILFHSERLMPKQISDILSKPPYSVEAEMRGAMYQILNLQIVDLRDRKLVKKKPGPKSTGMMPGAQIDVVALEKYLPQLGESSRKVFLALHDECKNAVRAGIALKMLVEHVKHSAYCAAKDLVEMIEEDLNSTEPVDSDDEKVLAQYLPELSEIQSQVYHLVNDEQLTFADIAEQMRMHQARVVAIWLAAWGKLTYLANPESEIMNLLFNRYLSLEARR